MVFLLASSLPFPDKGDLSMPGRASMKKGAGINGAEPADDLMILVFQIG